MAASDDLQALITQAINNRTFEVVWRGETLPIEVANERLAALVKAEKKAAAAAKRKGEELEVNLGLAQQALNNARSAFDLLSRNRNATAAQLRAASQNLDNAQNRYDSLFGQTPAEQARVRGEAALGRISAAAGRTEEDIRREAFEGRPGPVTEPKPEEEGAPVVTTSTAAPKKVTRANVTAELAKRGLPDTPENRATVRAELEGTKTKASWEELVAQQAGEYAYLLDPKYEGVPELLRKAVEQKWFASEEGKAQFLQEFKKTSYAQNTTKLQQAFDVKTPAEKQSAIQKAINDIRSEYGEIQFDQAALEEVAGVAARNGSTGIDLGRLVYRAAFKRGAAAPTFTAPTAAKTALGGADADRIRAIYRAYGQRPDDDQIARILAQETDPASGVVMTEDMLRNNLRDLAKVSYKPFADLLDRGVSVQTIFSPYQQIAASVLEQAPDQVALIDDRGVPTKFATALMGKEPMSLTEWITTLKSDNKYGWQFTNEAKQQATNLVMDLEKAFGYRA